MTGQMGNVVTVPDFLVLVSFGSALGKKRVSLKRAGPPGQ